jgi:hypothetical protein
LIEILQSRFKFHIPPTHLDGYRNIDKRTYWSLTFRPVKEASEPRRFIGTETDLLQHADAGALSIAGADDLLNVKMFRREWIKLLRIERFPANFQLALPHALSPLGVTIAEALHLELQDWFEGDRARLAVVIIARSRR